MATPVILSDKDIDSLETMYTDSLALMEMAPGGVGTAVRGVVWCAGRVLVRSGAWSWVGRGGMRVARIWRMTSNRLET